MENVRKIYNLSKKYLFPVILVLFALIKVNKGINLADTTYSLGNYRFFWDNAVSQGTGLPGLGLQGTLPGDVGSEAIGVGAWFLLTFVANLVGFVLTFLPGGGTMLGMKIYTSLIVGGMGLFAYRFFKTKMPAWLAFLAEMVALGMCWAPSVVLYHYLTYAFLLVGAVFLYRGLAREKNRYLFIAGVVLGVNALVKFPNNGLEVLLIIPLIMYEKLKKHEPKELGRKILICVGGYVAGFAVFMTLMSCLYGWDSFANLINGVMGISNSASDYTFGEMLRSIISAYGHGLRWGIYIVICTLMGVPFFLLYEGKYMKLRKVVYCLCIAFLFFVLGRWGMFNFKYYQKESALIWGTIFLLISIVVDVWMIFTTHLSDDWRILGCISLIIILITPLGSNNYIWPVLNNLFFIAPITAWIIYKFVRWGRTYLDVTKKVPLFAPKAMLMGCLLAFTIQALGVGIAYVFADGEDGQSVTASVSDNHILTGMRTTPATARSLSELSAYMNSNYVALGDENAETGEVKEALAGAEKNGIGGIANDKRKLILYGNIPGLSYILDRPCAISTSWPDLDSYPVEDMTREFEALDASINQDDAAIQGVASQDAASPDAATQGAASQDAATVKGASNRPTVIINRLLYEMPDNSIKLNLVMSFIENNDYQIVFDNDAFVVYE